MTSQTFSPVSAERWQDIKVALAQQSVNISTDSGNISSHGVNVSWDYSGDTLTVIIESVSMLDKMAGYSEQTIMEKFAGWINGVA